MHLSTNMHVYSRVGTLAGKPADVLLKNGSGSIPISSMVDYIRIPPESGNVVDTKSSKLSFLVLYTKFISMHNGFVKEQSLLQEMTVLHTLTTSYWMTFQMM